MAAAPLKEMVAVEAVGAVLTGALLLVVTGDVAARLALPPAPPSWAIVRLTAVLLIGFGALLWAVRSRVETDRPVIRALAIGHLLAAVVLAIQYVAIWNTGTGLLLAIVPLGLGIRYAQVGFRRTPDVQPAVVSPGT
jgi:hypothetical protein